MLLGWHSMFRTPGAIKLYLHILKLPECSMVFEKKMQCLIPGIVKDKGKSCFLWNLRKFVCLFFFLCIHVHICQKLDCCSVWLVHHWRPGTDMLHSILRICDKHKDMILYTRNMKQVPHLVTIGRPKGTLCSSIQYKLRSLRGNVANKDGEGWQP